MEKVTSSFVGKDFPLFDDLYAESPPPTPTLRRPKASVAPLLIAFVGMVVLTVMILPSFMATYHERAQRFERHREFLTDSGLCDQFLQNLLREQGEAHRANVLSNVHVENARYHNINTNCEEAYQFVQQLKFVGALDDWYTSTNLYHVLTASSWKVQVVIIVTIPSMCIVGLRFFLQYLSRRNAVNQAFDAIKPDSLGIGHLSRHAVIIDAANT